MMSLINFSLLDCSRAFYFLLRSSIGVTRKKKEREENAASGSGSKFKVNFYNYLIVYDSLPIIHHSPVCILNFRLQVGHSSFISVHPK
jgi:hypothetical protein